MYQQQPRNQKYPSCGERAPCLQDQTPVAPPLPCKNLVLSSCCSFAQGRSEVSDDQVKVAKNVLAEHTAAVKKRASETAAEVKRQTESSEVSGESVKAAKEGLAQQVVKERSGEVEQKHKS